MLRRRLMYLCLVSLLLPGSGWARAGGSQPAPLPAEVAKALDAYERTLARHLQWKVHLRMEAEAVEPDRPAAQSTTPFSIDWIYYKDSERAAVSTIRREKGKVVGAYRSVIDGWFVSYPLPPPGQDALMAQFGGNAALRRGSSIPQALPALEGFAAADYVGLLQIIRSASKVSSSREAVDGHDCIAVHAVSDDYGDYRLWFDPAFDYYPVKIVVQKSGENYWSGRRLSEARNFASAKTGAPVGSRYVTFAMDRAKFDQIGGGWFPAECHISRLQMLEDGSSHRIDGVSRRLALDLGPQPAAEFAAHLRQGARLSNLENPQIPYCWQDGKPVPLVDQATLRHMDKTADVLRSQTATGGEGAR